MEPPSKEWPVMNARSQLRDPFANLQRHGTFSAWAMAIAFATVAVGSFAIDQSVRISPNPQEESAVSWLHPVQLIESIMAAVSE
jgi:hypothetical protein